MEKNRECMYCMEDERRADLMIEIAQLEVSTVFLFKEQSHKGRCNVVYKDHVKELFQLTAEELSAFMKDVQQAAAAVDRAFGPDKLNYGAYGDKLHHLHMHIVPKYAEQKDWGSIFEMNPGLIYLSEEEYAERVAQISKYL